MQGENCNMCISNTVYHLVSVHSNWERISLLKPAFSVQWDGLRCYKVASSLHQSVSPFNVEEKVALPTVGVQRGWKPNWKITPWPHQWKQNWKITLKPRQTEVSFPRSGHLAEAIESMNWFDRLEDVSPLRLSLQPRNANIRQSQLCSVGHT